MLRNPPTAATTTTTLIMTQNNNNKQKAKQTHTHPKHNNNNKTKQKQSNNNNIIILCFVSSKNYRQRKRWEDNIKEWTGLPWNITLRKAENREEWRKLVVKSTVVPQRSARLRDR